MGAVLEEHADDRHERSRPVKPSPRNLPMSAPGRGRSARTENRQTSTERRTARTATHDGVGKLTDEADRHRPMSAMSGASR